MGGFISTVRLAEKLASLVYVAGIPQKLEHEPRLPLSKAIRMSKSRLPVSSPLKLKEHVHGRVSSKQGNAH